MILVIFLKLGKHQVEFPELFHRVLKFRDDARQYHDKCACLRIYHELVCAHGARAEHHELLASLVAEAKEAYEEAHRSNQMNATNHLSTT